jgi:oligopeptide transport system ATP-binding protein
MIGTQTASEGKSVVSIRGLEVSYRTRGVFKPGRPLRAVDGVTLEIGRGETLGLVGESGCGKSSLGRAILRLEETSGGQIVFDGADLGGLPASQLRRLRRRFQMIFQDPYASLDPRMTAGQIIAEPIRAFGLAKGNAVGQRVDELLETVGLGAASGGRYPKEFSGGQRQRIGIARALAAEPEFVVADEPISALDVSIQAQVLNLLARLRRERGLTLLFISHDLRAVRHLADRIAVMYLGKIVEVGPAAKVYEKPLMPYTKALVSAVPAADPVAERSRQRILLKGDVPSPLDPPCGCRFHPRCPFAIAECGRMAPRLIDIAPGHSAACIRISPEHPDIEANAAASLGAIAAVS